MYVTEPRMEYKKEEVWYPLAFDIWHWEKDCHSLMLNDAIRMVAYQKAIQEVVKPGMTVLDIGTGTGILAEWALEAGAKKVYGVDINREVIQIAEDRLNEAGFSGSFQLMNKLSYDVELPERVDVILSEILGNLADNQQMTPILDDARNRFLKKDGALLPLKVQTYLVPVSSSTIHDQIRNGRFKNLNENYSLPELMNRFGVTSNFDMPFNAIVPKSCYLAEPKVVKEFYFKGQDEAEYTTHVKYKVSRSEIFTGFKGYFVAQLSPNVILNISDDDIDGKKTSDCWKHVFLAIEKPFRVQIGDEVNLEYQRFCQSEDKRSFVQGYKWSGCVIRANQTVYEFSQQLGRN